MATLPQDIFKLSVLASRILEAIRMLSVLPKCMDNLLSSNHPRIAFSSMLSVFCMTAGFIYTIIYNLHNNAKYIMQVNLRMDIG